MKDFIFKILDKQTIQNTNSVFSPFSCVQKDLCGVIRSGTIPRDGLIALEDQLLLKVAEAELAECDSDDEVCCHEDNVYYDYEDYPDIKKCQEIPGYS